MTLTIYNGPYDCVSASTVRLALHLWLLSSPISLLLFQPSSPVLSLLSLPSSLSSPPNFLLSIQPPN